MKSIQEELNIFSSAMTDIDGLFGGAKTISDSSIYIDSSESDGFHVATMLNLSSQISKLAFNARDQIEEEFKKAMLENGFNIVNIDHGGQWRGDYFIELSDGTFYRATPPQEPKKEQSSDQIQQYRQDIDNEISLLKEEVKYIKKDTIKIKEYLNLSESFVKLQHKYIALLDKERELQGLEKINFE